MQDVRQLFASHIHKPVGLQVSKQVGHAIPVDDARVAEKPQQRRIVSVTIRKDNSAAAARTCLVRSCCYADCSTPWFADRWISVLLTGGYMQLTQTTVVDALVPWASTPLEHWGIAGRAPKTRESRRRRQRGVGSGEGLCPFPENLWIFHLKMVWYGAYSGCVVFKTHVSHGL